MSLRESTRYRGGRTSPHGASERGRAGALAIAAFACTAPACAHGDGGKRLLTAQHSGSTDPEAACAGSGAAVPVAERVSNGHPVLPPKWAFGVLWGSYYDQVGSAGAHGGDLVAAARRLRVEYSGDLLWIDSSWLWHEYSNAGSHYVCFRFDPETFPDPAAMIATLREDHFHFGVWEWPWMGHGCEHFDEGVRRGYFVMKRGVPAPTRGAWHGDPHPAAFDYTSAPAVGWWQRLNAPLSDWGLDFLKLDTVAEQQDSAVAAGGTLADAAASYTREYHRAAYAVTQAYALAHDPRAIRNGVRGFILPKSGSPANDQEPGWWTDDTPATWEGLRLDMSRASKLDTPETAAYWCGDTGGYGGVPGDELYVRWLEYSTFTPLQEFFGGKAPGIGARFPWLFGAEAQRIQKQYAELRYRLLPFRYSNALRAYEADPVAYPVTWIGASQIVVGSGASEILVQPVTVPGATKSTVVLPPGDWVDIVAGDTCRGTVTVATPLDREPIFAKAGSIIPMGPTLRWVDERPADPLTLDIYPSGATSYTLYEDDGVGQGYMGGAYSTTEFSCDTTTGRPVIRIGAQTTAKYRYAGQLCSRTYLLKVNGQRAAPATVTRDGRALSRSTAAGFDAAVEGWTYDAASRTVWIKLPLSSAASAVLSL